jgi:hypothetical protein
MAEWVKDILLKDSNNTAMIQESREAALNFAGGIGVKKLSLSLTGNGATVKNVFKITGSLIITELMFVAQTVTDATTFSNVKFAVNDSTNTVDLTAVVDGSSTVTGSKFYKSAVAGTALTHAKADQIRIVESAFNKPFVETIVNTLPSADNYVQLLFTGDAATNITVNVFMRYVPLCRNCSVTVV